MQNRLEQYLDEVDGRLGSLPPAERAELREEARQHLQALAEAHEELGCPPEAAAEAAIYAFGDPAWLGRKLRATSPSTRAARRALVASLLAVSWFLGVTIVAVNTWLLGTDLQQAAGQSGGGPLWAAMHLLWIGLAVGGAVMGRWGRRSALGGTVVLPYLGVIVAGLCLTDTASVLGVLGTFGAAGVAGAGLALASAAARGSCLARREG